MPAWLMMLGNCFPYLSCSLKDLWKAANTNCHLLILRFSSNTVASGPCTRVSHITGAHTSMAWSCVPRISSTFHCACEHPSPNVAVVPSEEDRQVLVSCYIGLLGLRLLSFSVVPPGGILNSIYY